MLAVPQAAEVLVGRRSHGNGGGLSLKGLQLWFRRTRDERLLSRRRGCRCAARAPRPRRGNCLVVKHRRTIPRRTHPHSPWAPRRAQLHTQDLPPSVCFMTANNPEALGSFLFAPGGLLTRPIIAGRDPRCTQRVHRARTAAGALIANIQHLRHSRALDHRPHATRARRTGVRNTHLLTGNCMASLIYTICVPRGLNLVALRASHWTPGVPYGTLPQRLT